MNKGVSCSESFWIRDSVLEFIKGRAVRVSYDDIRSYLSRVPMGLIYNELLCLVEEGKIRRLYREDIPVYEVVRA